LQVTAALFNALPTLTECNAVKLNVLRVIKRYEGERAEEKEGREVCKEMNSGRERERDIRKQGDEWIGSGMEEQ
jgi:hypothetical protein